MQASHANGDRKIRDCGFWLDRLTTENLTHLGCFAGSRLIRFGLSTEFKEDLTFKALAAVVRGTSGTGHGRRPRPQDLENTEAFLNFLRGAVASTVEAFARRAEHGHEHTPLDGLVGITLPAGTDPDHVMADLKTQLFERLRARAPARLAPTIRVWEAEFLWSDRVPSYPNSHHARAVRQLAKEIIFELDPGIVQFNARASERSVRRSLHRLRHRKMQSGR
jgi:hypothetical protein